MGSDGFSLQKVDEQPPRLRAGDYMPDFLQEYLLQRIGSTLSIDLAILFVSVVDAVASQRAPQPDLGVPQHIRHTCTASNTNAANNTNTRPMQQAHMIGYR